MAAEHKKLCEGNFQACCCPEMNYDMIRLKEGDRGSGMRFQAWKDREDEVSKGGVLSDEEAWWMCVSMLQKQRFVWVEFCWQSPVNGHTYQTEMLLMCPLGPLWPAGQLFAEQQCAAVLQCPWTPSGLLWRGRCCWMEKKETMTSVGTPVYLCGHPHLAVDGFWSRLLSFANSAKIATRALFGKAVHRGKHRKQSINSSLNTSANSHLIRTGDAEFEWLFSFLKTGTFSASNRHRYLVLED